VAQKKKYLKKSKKNNNNNFYPYFFKFFLILAPPNYFFFNLAPQSLKADSTLARNPTWAGNHIPWVGPPRGLAVLAWNSKFFMGRFYPRGLGLFNWADVGAKTWGFLDGSV
jgi:hypothetical protein